MLTRNLARRAVATAPRSVASTSRAGGVLSQLRFSSGTQNNDPNEESSWDEWNEKHPATESEEAVKADHTVDGNPEALQRKSLEHIHKVQIHADDVTSGTTEAEYERDEVDGPLRHAPGTSTVEETVEETVETVKKGRVGS